MPRDLPKAERHWLLIEIARLVDYSNGNARLRYTGLPRTKFYNLDPDSRCGHAGYGCVVMGNEWVTQTPYNCAVRLLTASCGDMQGAYHGTYPTYRGDRDRSQLRTMLHPEKL